MISINENISFEFLDSNCSGPSNPTIYYSDPPDKQPDSGYMTKAMNLYKIVQMRLYNRILEAIISL